MPDLLDPKNDYVFKRLFAEAPDLLVALINDLRPDLPDITAVEVLNPNIDPEELRGKYIFLDVLARDANGHQYNVEMRVRRYNAWGQRSAYYLARMLGQQLAIGEEFNDLKAAVGIHLLDFDLFDTTPEQRSQAVWRFEMRDGEQPDVTLGNELQLNLVELKKADRLGHAFGPLAAWVTFFEHWREEHKMAEIKHAPVQEAISHVRELSADEEARRLAFVRERALHDEATLLKEARQEGREEGEAAILLGQLEAKFGALDNAVRERVQAADGATLQRWSLRVLTATSLEAIFEED